MSLDGEMLYLKRIRDFDTGKEGGERRHSFSK